MSLAGAAMTFGGKLIYPSSGGLLANSYYCPSGIHPGIGYVILSETDARSLVDSSSTAVTWPIQYKNGPVSRSITLRNLYPIYCQRIDGGSENSTKQFALLKFADVRYFLWRYAINDKLYANVQKNTLHPPQSNGEVTDSDESSWQTFINEIWTKFPSALVGAAPTLPWSPDGVPMNWQQYGGNAWKFLGVVLEKIGCKLIYDPTASSNWFSIVRMSQSQTVSIDSSTTARVIFRDEATVGIASRIPEKVRVLFHKHYTTLPDWSTTASVDLLEDSPVYHEDVATSVSGVVTGTYLELWDDLPAEINRDNAVQNTSALTTRATERKNELVNYLNRSSYLKAFRIYSGIEDVRNGSEVHAVRWRDFGDDDYGLCTEVWRGVYQPNAPEGFGPNEILGDGISVERESLGPPDLARRTWIELQQPIPAVLNEALNAQSSASASFMVADGSTDPTPLHPTGNFTCWDWMMNTGDSIANGSKIWVTWWKGFWFVVVPYCTTTNTNPPMNPPDNGTPPPAEAFPAGMLFRRSSQQLVIANIALGSSTGSMTGENETFP